MNDELRELYQQIILDHNRSPRNFGDLPGATHSAEGYNPLCGDHYFVRAHVSEEGIIEKVFFEGSGCAISKASASLMTSAVKGKTLAEAKRIFEEFHGMVTGRREGEEEILGKLTVFSGVREFPVRVKCAALPWHTLVAALERKQEPVTTE